jgi:hypothetical protein|tara:strand:- start:164 stop:442 length:279 start_codon:yes stop_codon:yes gene_type:complete
MVGENQKEYWFKIAKSPGRFPWRPATWQGYLTILFILAFLITFFLIGDSIRIFNSSWMNMVAIILVALVIFVFIILKKGEPYPKNITKAWNT